MKKQSCLVALLLIAACLVAASDKSSTWACGGSGISTCVVSETACLKTMVLAKGANTVVTIGPGSPAVFNAPVNLYIGCPIATNCGSLCESAGEPTSASLTISLVPSAPFPANPPPVASGIISTGAGTMTLPTCDQGRVPIPSFNLAQQGPPGFNAYSIPVQIPAGTPRGVYLVKGQATVEFSDGMTLTATGDTLVCLVEEAPGMPGIPRLDLKLISETFSRVAPGDQSIAEYLITNNDPTHSVSLTAFAGSRQIALSPGGGNEKEGVFSIANPFGDDFPIAFDTNACVPIPDHPFTQSEISKALPTLGPGQSTTIRVSMRPYGQCGSGSCGESTLRVTGAFSDGTPARACGGSATYVDVSLPTQNCGAGVNDCNGNGVPDAVDLFNRSSQDNNFNALPDECEQGAPAITEPVTVIPQLAAVGSPIRVSVKTAGQPAVTRVLVNGIALTSRDGMLWEGEVSAAREVGPQTVFAIAMNSAGQLATHIGTYDTRALAPGDLDCRSICFRSSEYFLLNLDRLPGGSVIIGGVNFNSPVNIQGNTRAVQQALQGRSSFGFGALTPLQRLNQEFVAAQLNLAFAGGRGSLDAFNALKGQLICYGVDFPPVRLSNGFPLAPESRLMDLVHQSELAIRENRTGDMPALAGILGLLNGNDPRNRCR